jgi:hypothetical protein
LGNTRSFCVFCLDFDYFLELEGYLHFSSSHLVVWARHLIQFAKNAVLHEAVSIKERRLGRVLLTRTAPLGVPCRRESLEIKLEG